MSGDTQSQHSSDFVDSHSFRSAFRFLVGSFGFTLVLLAALGALFLGLSASFTLVHEWGSGCGTGKMAAKFALFQGGALFVLCAAIGTFFCGRFDYCPRVARLLALVANTVAATCFVFAVAVLPILARFSR